MPTMLALVEQLRSYLGGGCSTTPCVYVSESCIECERVRAACERLGALATVRGPDSLPPPQQQPAPPSYLVTAPFEGELFDAAHKAKYRVLGPTAVLQLAEREEPPPANARPLYSLAMRGAVICFSGFRKKDELTYLITLIHYMGGSIRKDMSSKVTHLIAAAATGDKYRYASGFGLPVLARSWVDACWERRDDPACFATDDAMIKEHKLKVFAGARVCFVGFPEDETQHMAEVLASNGGATCALDDADCTHVVVDEHNTVVAPECSLRVHVVKAEWFWASVQNEEAQDEREYLFKDYLEEVSRRSSVGGACGAVAEEGAGAAGGTPAALQRLRKRKLRGGDAALHKRRSSVGDAVLLSLSGNLLDCTPSPDGKQLLEESEVPDNVVRKLMSPRQQVFMELLQTESNYVGILHTIVNMFKQPLEEMAEEDTSNGKNQALLNNTELKIIFGNLPPIYELHQRMLEELHYAQAHWSEEVSIGRLVLKYTPDMVKAYPPFVNFFENTKEMLQQCDRENPRFHAFLKICQTKPECGRQSLQELLIRPVQRLPSISLLLDDILKHTHKSNPDHAALVSALAGLREVMSHINEDKRKTEGQLQMFDIYNDIDQCPAHLVSSHRSFVSRCEVVELSKELSGRGDHLVLFLFTDTMEVCKKRSKAFNSKSPTNGTGTMRIGSSKPYRHISLMPLSTVKRVVDIREAEDCHNVFALMCRSNQELKEKLYSFMITDETVDKSHFLRQLCRQMANTVCKADADKFLACLESHQLDIDTSDLALSTLSKVSKFAARTRIKLEALAGLGGWLRADPGAVLLDTWVLRAHLLAQVGRALSFNKTPSKLKRAMSSMISPFGSTSNLTPASQLAQMRLASCNNINEMGASGGGEGGSVLVAPLSVQPTRKAGAGAAAALRRF
ncbi:protein ECT2 isoform X6 [Vanessa cardui]|uniref:protein ECT2 isoform X6 n=1 Tax=Vanessa cardui TaxID=171605 RepID=UPI001F139CF9|nr:protein ECT2 isoform X6 [Vanessa cardui]